jgi:membrane protein implicated in regulation of membrane protease activity
MIDLHPLDTAAHAAVLLSFKYTFLAATAFIIAVIAWELWQAHRRAKERIKQLKEQARQERGKCAREMQSIKGRLRHDCTDKDGRFYVDDEAVKECWGEAA